MPRHRKKLFSELHGQSLDCTSPQRPPPPPSASSLFSPCSFSPAPRPPCPPPPAAASASASSSASSSSVLAAAVVGIVAGFSNLRKPVFLSKGWLAVSPRPCDSCCDSRAHTSRSSGLGRLPFAPRKTKDFTSWWETRRKPQTEIYSGMWSRTNSYGPRRSLSINGRARRGFKRWGLLALQMKHLPQSHIWESNRNNSSAAILL